MCVIEEVCFLTSPRMWLNIFDRIGILDKHQGS